MHRSSLTRRTLLTRGAAIAAATWSAPLLLPARARAQPRTHHDAIVIGSGFGGAIAAYRLATAGIDVLTLERGRAWCQSDDAIVFDSALDYRDPRWLWEPKVTRTSGLMQPYLAGSVGIATTACVGGGSIIYAGATVPPVRRYFEKIFPAALSYDELETVYWPRALARLDATQAPADLLGSAPFAHVRSADAQLTRAGMVTEPVRSTFDWDIVRQVFDRPGGSRTVDTAGCSWNRNSAKKSVTRNYLRWAADRPSWSLLPLRDVQNIAHENGKFVVDVAVIDEAGGSETYTCNHLFVAAGSIGTTRLLLRARARGGLPDLNEHLGTMVGDNGDQVTWRVADELAAAGPQASAIVTSALVDDEPDHPPIRVESIGLPGPPGEAPILAQLSTTADWENRASWTMQGSEPTLSFAPDSWRDSLSAALRVHERVGVSASALSRAGGAPFVPGMSLTAHPLGGVPIGRATDIDGRVIGYPNLYVIDGSLIPGNCAAANPSLTIAGIAERVMDRVIADVVR
ncbi:GMC oxidoreductase [Nocardia ninae]|uniref:Cholesterol oxidase n=1 Tax=Nocardia ninae NBRC 108245 TaxID=1210091 RepID=A0A511M5N4_9NOCA|nr:GMC oxidoreductase [Nocardia ninae]GEM35964.1 cholesterol oxidase [Nocardia ninae NBRC 108245]